MPSGLVITSVLAELLFRIATATKFPFAYSTLLHSLWWVGLVTWRVHVMPSGLVIASESLFPSPTATNNPSPNVTDCQLTTVPTSKPVQHDVAGATGVQVGSVVRITRVVPLLDTATYTPLPKAMSFQMFASAARVFVHVNVDASVLADAMELKLLTKGVAAMNASAPHTFIRRSFFMIFSSETADDNVMSLSIPLVKLNYTNSKVNKMVPCE
jgi:hypothetical protein